MLLVLVVAYGCGHHAPRSAAADPEIGSLLEQFLHSQEKLTGGRELNREREILRGDLDQDGDADLAVLYSIATEEAVPVSIYLGVFRNGGRSHAFAGRIYVGFGSASSLSYEGGAVAVKIAAQAGGDSEAVESTAWVCRLDERQLACEKP